MYAFVQQADGVVNGSGTTVATGTGGTDFPAGLTLGNLKWFVVLYVAGAQVVITLSDPNNNNAAHVQVGTAFASSVGAVWGYVKNLPGGTGTTTAVAASAVTFFSVYCAEYSGLDTAVPFQTTFPGGSRQASPGTGTDAVTSGTVTPLAQPAAVIGYTHDSSANTLANAGTGFTARTGAVNYGSGLVARPEDKRITNLVSLAATWTAVGGTGTFWSFVGVFSEPAVSVINTPPMPFYNTIHIQE